jgi:hypothetical protein
MSYITVSLSPPDNVDLLIFCQSSEQKLFAKSQTWYRPHGTETHRVSELVYNHACPSDIRS